MRILAALAASVLLAACSRSDKNATDEPVGTTTVTAAPVVTRAWSRQGELDRRIEATNQIDIDDSEPVDTDETISFRLQRALLTDPSVVDHAEEVSIEVNQGTATLRGATASNETRLTIERIALLTAGVVRVENRVVVRAAPKTS